MAIEVRWMGPLTSRRDGPENRVFKRGRWLPVTEEEVAYFRRTPDGWEMREAPQGESQSVEDVEVEVPEAEERMLEVGAPTEKPDLQVLRGSALEGEPEDEGFVEVTKPEEEPGMEAFV